MCFERTRTKDCNRQPPMKAPGRVGEEGGAQLEECYAGGMAA